MYHEKLSHIDVAQKDNKILMFFFFFLKQDINLSYRAKSQ